MFTVQNPLLEISSFTTSAIIKNFYKAGMTKIHKSKILPVIHFNFLIKYSEDNNKLDLGDVMKFKFYSLFILISIVLLSACQQDIKDAVDWPIRDDIVFTDQNNKPLNLKDLKGEVLVADFIFTSCTDICPPMTANMARLQELVKKKGIKKVHFVSFSVDPTVDSPQALKAFAKKFNVDQSNWSFLTGYSQNYIEMFAKNSFKTLVKKPQQDNQVIHGIDFYLVGPDGRIKKYYSGFKQVQYNEIIHDIQALQ